MLNGISRQIFQDRSQPVRLRGTRNVQRAHCAASLTDAKYKEGQFKPAALSH